MYSIEEPKNLLLVITAPTLMKKASLHCFLTYLRGAICNGIRHQLVQQIAQVLGVAAEGVIARL